MPWTVIQYKQKLTITIPVFVWNHSTLNNRHDYSSEATFAMVDFVYHFPKVELTSDYSKQTQMTQWPLWVIRSLWCCKQLLVSQIIKVLNRVGVFFGHTGLFCMMSSWGPADSDCTIYWRCRVCFFYALQYTSLCHFYFLFRAGWAGRDYLDWQAQRDSRSDVTLMHGLLNQCRLELNIFPAIPFMIMFHLNMQIRC